MLIDLTQLPFFLAAFAALMITPGPDMAFILSHGVAMGPRAGIAAAFGFSTGALLHVVLTAVGLAALVAAEPVALDIIRYAGAAYLAWIGLRILMTPGGFLGVGKMDDRHSLRQVFMRAIMTNITNPKVVLFFLVFLPQFVTPGGASVGWQLLAWGLLLNFLALLVNIGFGLGAGAIGRLMTHSPAMRFFQRYGLAVMFLALAARLAISEI